MLDLQASGAGCRAVGRQCCTGHRGEIDFRIAAQAARSVALEARLGDGAQFEINITRQFIESALEDDDAISQLQLTYKFSLDNKTVALGSGNRWCKSQSEVPRFREFILSNPAFLAIADVDPPNVSVHHEYV